MTIRTLLIHSLIPFLLFPTLLIASQMNISPVRVELSSKEKVSTITVANPSDDPLLIQTQIVDWTQKNREDIYKPSTDILVVPPSFTIAPHSKQIVRLAYKKTFDSGQEKAYRLILKEIPQIKAKDKPLLQFTLDVRIPVFTLPIAISEKPDWQIVNQGKDYEIRLQNHGNTSLMISELRLEGEQSNPLIAKQAVFKYVLPQQDMSWRFPKISLTPAHKLKLIAQMNGREIIHETSSM